MFPFVKCVGHHAVLVGRWFCLFYDFHFARLCTLMVYSPVASVLRPLPPAAAYSWTLRPSKRHICCCCTVVPLLRCFCCCFYNFYAPVVVYALCVITFSLEKVSSFPAVSPAACICCYYVMLCYVVVVVAAVVAMLNLWVKAFSSIITQLVTLEDLMPAPALFLLLTSPFFSANDGENNFQFPKNISPNAIQIIMGSGLLAHLSSSWE